MVILAFISIENQKQYNGIISLILIIIIRLLNTNPDYPEGKIKQMELVRIISKYIVRKLPENTTFIDILMDKGSKNIDEEDLNLIKEFYLKYVLNMPVDIYFTLGTTLISILTENIDILNIEPSVYDPKDKKRYINISIKDKYRNTLIHHTFNPIVLPLIAAPKEWILNKTEIQMGGYYTKEMNKIVYGSTFVKKSIKNLINSEIGSIQINSINFLNKQRYKINKIMFNFFKREFQKENSKIFKGLNRIHPLTNDILNINDKNKKEKILSHNSIFYLNKNILDIAGIYENSSFYFPHFMDFRGRIYSNVNYLNYQGSDLARGLIEFDNGCELDEESINFVYQALANSAGKNKLTIRSKINWALEFIDEFKFYDFDYLLNNFDNLCIINNLLKEINEPAQFCSIFFSLIS